MGVKTTLIIDGVEDDGNPLIEEFWGYFGGKPDGLKAEEEEKKQPDYTLSLQHVSDASGVMECNEVCSGKLDKSKLDSNDAFILDAGGSVFVWIGKGANKAEKRDAMKFAVQYLTDQGRGADVPIARVMEGKEPKEFWNAFNGQPGSRGGLHLPGHDPSWPYSAADDVVGPPRDDRVAEAVLPGGWQRPDLEVDRGGHAAGLLLARRGDP